MININTQELLQILDSTPANQNIMLVGNHGIGKSQILTQYYEAKNCKVVPLFLGQMSDPGDIIGLPDKDGQHTIFRPPYWFPTNNQPIVLFLDELNRARPEVLQTIMDLALNRKIAGRALPNGSRIISAVNEGDEYQLTDLDPALVSRFNVYRFLPTTEEWLLWASKNNIDERVLNFIADSPAWLDGVDGIKQHIDTGLEKTPDRRAWQRVSDIISGTTDLYSLHNKIIAGIVGVPAAAKFMAFVSTENAISGIDILLHFDNIREKLKSYRIHQLSALNESIMRTLDSNKFSTDEIIIASKNIEQYINLLTDSNKKEAIAHIASCFSTGNYNTAITFIICNAPKVYEQLMNYISTL